MGANFQIQSSGAEMCKFALLRCSKLIESKLPEVKIISQIHDELLFELPGLLTLDLAKSKIVDGVITKPYWIVPNTTLEIAHQLRATIAKAGTDYIGGILECGVGEPTIAPYWSK